ncbi:MAG TPA: hypothetical protein VMU65_02595, partial [Candidatus Saccharimonadales bacterium]|nr:hypothetical protein [Candidatus Saccharimonadales bacterium]
TIRLGGRGELWWLAAILEERPIASALTEFESRFSSRLGELLTAWFVTDKRSIWHSATEWPARDALAWIHESAGQPA